MGLWDILGYVAAGAAILGAAALLSYAFSTDEVITKKTLHDRDRDLEKDSGKLLYSQVSKFQSKTVVFRNLYDRETGEKMGEDKAETSKWVDSSVKEGMTIR